MFVLELRCKVRKFLAKLFPAGSVFSCKRFSFWARFRAIKHDGLKKWGKMFGVLLDY